VLVCDGQIADVRPHSYCVFNLEIVEFLSFFCKSTLQGSIVGSVYYQSGNIDLNALVSPPPDESQYFKKINMRKNVKKV
jgi:hypothetical protein